jgi:hypothetical protein
MGRNLRRIEGWWTNDVCLRKPDREVPSVARRREETSRDSRATYQAQFRRSGGLGAEGSGSRACGPLCVKECRFGWQHALTVTPVSAQSHASPGSQPGRRPVTGLP